MKNQPFYEAHAIARESPFIEIQGRLEYKADCTTPEYFIRSPTAIELYGDRVTVDHFVLTLASPEAVRNYSDRLVELGAEILEGPGQWPDDFCQEDDPFPEDLAMYFLSAILPTGGIVVLLAPHAANDRLDRDFQEQGDRAVPHIAIRVNSIYAAADRWRQKGFLPLSNHPQNDGSLCQWFVRNWAGQVIELIQRKPGGRETFSCENIRGLRLSEVES